MYTIDARQAQYCAKNSAVTNHSLLQVFRTVAPAAACNGQRRGIAHAPDDPSPVDVISLIDQRLKAAIDHSLAVKGH